MASSSLAVGESRLAQRLTLEAAIKEEYGNTGSKVYIKAVVDGVKV